MISRRSFFRNAGVAGAAVVGAVAATSVSRVAMAALPEPVLQTKADTMPPLVPGNGRHYNPVVTLNGWTLPWRMNSGVKEFHLVAEPVVREMCEGFKAHLWGYNGQSPGPTIEVVEAKVLALQSKSWKVIGCVCSSRISCPSIRPYIGMVSACQTAWTA